MRRNKLSGIAAKGGLLATVSLAVLCCTAQAALAQEVDAKELSADEIVVTGYRGSLKDALNVKMKSELVVEAISSKDIGQLPDVTIAEALVRLPGLNATRDRGNNSQATIRGLGPRLVLGLVNGREVASSEPDRGIRWEQYPSELVSGAQVYKSQSADLVSGGVAGTVDLGTVAPLDHTGPNLTVRAGPVYYEAGDDIPGYNPFGYRASATYVGALTDKLGIAVGVTSQKQRNAFPSLQGWGYNNADHSGDIDGDGSIDLAPWGAQTEVKKMDQDRIGVMGVLQFRATDNFELKYDALYSSVDIAEEQNQAWFQNWGNWDGLWTDYAAATIVDGDVVGGTVNDTWVRNVIAKYSQTNSVFANGLNAKWNEGPWTVTADASYSVAKRDNIWNSIYSDNGVPVVTSWDWSAGHKPWISTATPPTDTANQWLGWSLQDGPQHLKDDLYAGRLDVSRELDGGFLTAVDVGARYAERTKKFDRSSWWQGPITDRLPDSLVSTFLMKGIQAPALLDAPFDEAVKAAFGQLDESLATEDLAARWNVKEKVTEGYLKLKFESELGSIPVSGNAGVRVAHTKVTSKGKEAVNAGPLSDVAITNSYTDVLPSLNLNFTVGDNQFVRLGLAKAVARPPLDELRAGRTLNNLGTVPTGSGGNPTLKPYRSTQADLSFEWYFAPEALASVSVYYKDIASHIGYFSEPVDIEGVTYDVYRPANGKGGHIAGMEATFQTPFTFLPGPLKDFGIYANYAYVSSNIKEFAPANNPMDAGGLAKHTATADLWYSNGGFEARLGYKYHSRFTVIPGWNPEALRTLEAESVLDFSTSYAISDHWSVRLQVNNLTNTPMRMNYDGNRNRLARYDLYGRRVLADVTFKF